MQPKDRPSDYAPDAWEANGPGYRAAIVRQVRRRAPTGASCVWDRFPIRVRKPGSFLEQARRMLRRRDGEKCRLCPAIEGLQVDHVVPLSQDGRHAIDNMQLLCGPCHVAKTTADRRPRPEPVA
jgi:5-methylcytosine-specific restriction endonuclease McrA